MDLARLHEPRFFLVRSAGRADLEAKVLYLPEKAERGASPDATPVLSENSMSQRLLPIFPDAVTPIKALLSVGKQEERVVHFHGVLLVLSHAAPS